VNLAKLTSVVVFDDEEKARLEDDYEAEVNPGGNPQYF